MKEHQLSGTGTVAGNGTVAGFLRAGVAKSDITTDAKGVVINDPLYAKALVLDDGKTKLAIIAMDATHELYQMENPNIAGVGSWAGFYLYLKEIYFKDESSTEFYQQIKTNFK